MRFRLYRCYKHKKEEMYMKIIGRLDSDMYGKCLAGEVLVSGYAPNIKPVGKSAEHAQNWTEVSKEEYRATLGSVMAVLKKKLRDAAQDPKMAAKLQQVTNELNNEKGAEAPNLEVVK